jgi:hypothetical protein
MQESNEHITLTSRVGCDYDIKLDIKEIDQAGVYLNHLNRCSFSGELLCVQQYVLDFMRVSRNFKHI